MRCTACVIVAWREAPALVLLVCVGIIQIRFRSGCATVRPTMGEDIYFYSAADDLLAEIVAGRLRAAGHAVELGPETAMRESLLSGAFSVAVFDAQLSDALALLAKLKERAAQTRVVLLLPEEAAKPSGLRIDGEAVLVEPFEVTALNVALDAQLAAVAADPSVLTVG